MAHFDLSPLGTLDTVLTIICQNDTTTPLSLLTFSDVFHRLSQQKRYNKISARDFPLIQSVLTKLVKDGYVATELQEYTDLVHTEITIDTEALYYATFEGQFFLMNGGYISKHKKEQLDIKSAKLNNRVLTLGSAIAALGAIGLLVVEYWKIPSRLSMLSTSFLIMFFIFGVIGGLMIALIIQVFINRGR